MAHAWENFLRLVANLCLLERNLALRWSAPEIGHSGWVHLTSQSHIPKECILALACLPWNSAVPAVIADIGSCVCWAPPQILGGQSRSKRSPFLPYVLSGLAPLSQVKGHLLHLADLWRRIQDFKCSSLENQEVSARMGRGNGF